MTAQRCQAPGCGRFIRADAMYCDRHDVGDGRRERADREEQPGARFRELVAKGEYTGLYEAGMRQIVKQAATAMREQGLDDEIGTLRVVLARLMLEENDVAKLASNVSRVASATVQAARAHRAIGGDTAEGLTSALTQILAELDEG